MFAQNSTYFLKILPVDNNARIELGKKTKKIKITDSTDIKIELMKITNKWKRKGYEFANIDSIVRESNIIKAFLFLGNKIHVCNISLNNIDNDILKELDIKNKKLSNRQLKFTDFIKIREKIINYFENTGYPFAQISIDSLNFKNNNINGVLSIKKNTLVKIDSIIYKGKPKISQKYINNYISIKKEDLYNQFKINNIHNALDKLPYISIQKNIEIEFRDNKADIYLYLKTKKYNYLNGIMGFASDEGNNLKIDGDLNVLLNNNFKIGETLNFRWNKYGKESQSIDFKTEFPYIFILPIGMNLGFKLEKYELDYLNTDFYAAFTYSFSYQNKIETYFRHKQSLLIKKDKSVNDFQETKSFSLGIKFIYDATDYILNPRKGMFINVASGFGYRTTELKKSQVADFESEIAYYIKLGKISTIALLNKSAAIFNNSGLFLNELYKIGGSNKLRGFDQKSIYTSAYSIFSVEPRLIIGKNSAFFLFGDYAYYESKYANTEIYDTPFSFGIGTNINTKAGIFQLTYALGKQFNNPFKLSNSKVHFGFVAMF